MANIGADKGLANYDKSDQYETLLKDIVNMNKSTLGDTSKLIDADPLLGPMLGPSKRVSPASLARFDIHIWCHSCI